MIAVLALAMTLEVDPGAVSVPALDSCPPPQAQEEVPAGFPILCYHHVSSEPGMYSVSPWRLESDLTRLAEEGFYLVTPEDLDNGMMQVPAGRRPVMVTFDDGWKDNMCYAADDPASLDPSCALAVMERVSERHPDLGRGAVFYLSWDKVPFGDKSLVEHKMNRLLDMGYAIGNHTLYHASFASLARDRWDRTVNGALDRFHRSLGLRSRYVSSLSYPGGALPKNVGAEEFMEALRHGGRRAVSFGCLVDGAVTSLRRLAETRLGRYRTSRIDMSRYSVEKLLRWLSLPDPGPGRRSLHDPLPYRMPPLASGPLEG